MSEGPGYKGFYSPSGSLGRVSLRQRSGGRPQAPKELTYPQFFKQPCYGHKLKLSKHKSRINLIIFLTFKIIIKF